MNIKLEELPLSWGINEENKLIVMKQPDLSKSCGAYALVAALGVMGKLPTNMTVTVNTNTQVLQVGDTFPQLATKIYVLSGILNSNLTGGRPETVLHGGLNSPAALIAIVKALCPGLATTIGFDSSKASYIPLRARYPKEFDRCFGNTGTTARQWPQATQTQLILVKQQNQNNFHWLACGTDHFFYDPNTGTMGNNSLTIGGITWEEAGLWITIG